MMIICLENLKLVGKYFLMRKAFFQNWQFTFRISSENFKLKKTVKFEVR